MAVAWYKRDVTSEENRKSTKKPYQQLCKASQNKTHEKILRIRNVEK